MPLEELPRGEERKLLPSPFPEIEPGRLETELGMGNEVAAAKREFLSHVLELEKSSTRGSVRSRLGILEQIPEGASAEEQLAHFEKGFVALPERVKLRLLDEWSRLAYETIRRGNVEDKGFFEDMLRLEEGTTNGGKERSRLGVIEKIPPSLSGEERLAEFEKLFKELPPMWQEKLRSVWYAQEFKKAWERPLGARRLTTLPLSWDRKDVHEEGFYRGIVRLVETIPEGTAIEELEEVRKILQNLPPGLDPRKRRLRIEEGFENLPPGTREKLRELFEETQQWEVPLGTGEKRGVMRLSPRDLRYDASQSSPSNVLKTRIAQCFSHSVFMTLLGRKLGCRVWPITVVKHVDGTRSEYEPDSRESQEGVDHSCRHAAMIDSRGIIHDQGFVIKHPEYRINTDGDVAANILLQDAVPGGFKRPTEDELVEALDKVGRAFGFELEGRETDVLLSAAWVLKELGHKIGTTGGPKLNAKLLELWKQVDPDTAGEVERDPDREKRLRDAPKEMAKRLFERVLEINKNEVRAHTGIAELVARENPDMALRSVENALKINPFDMFALQKKAEFLIKKADQETDDGEKRRLLLDALEAAISIIKKHPYDDGFAMHEKLAKRILDIVEPVGMGRVLGPLEICERLISAYEEILGKNPFNRPLWNLKGKTHAVYRDLSYDSQARLGLLIQLRERGLNGDILRNMKEVLDDQPDGATEEQIVGKLEPLLQKLMDIHSEEEIRSYKNALTVNIKDTTALDNYVSVLVSKARKCGEEEKQGHLEKALEAVEKHLEAVPGSLEGLLIKGVVLKEKGLLEEALSAFEEVRSLNRDERIINVDSDLDRYSLDEQILDSKARMGEEKLKEALGSQDPAQRKKLLGDAEERLGELWGKYSEKNGFFLPFFVDRAFYLLSKTLLELAEREEDPAEETKLRERAGRVLEKARELDPKIEEKMSPVFEGWKNAGN